MEVLGELKEFGATWIHFDEPLFVMDLEAHQLDAFSKSYSLLEEVLARAKFHVETYFVDVPIETYR